MASPDVVQYDCVIERAKTVMKTWEDPVVNHLKKLEKLVKALFISIGEVLTVAHHVHLCIYIHIYTYAKLQAQVAPMVNAIHILWQNKMQYISYGKIGDSGRATVSRIMLNILRGNICTFMFFSWGCNNTLNPKRDKMMEQNPRAMDFPSPVLICKRHCKTYYPEICVT
jgi:hypothetical protein